ncbi:MAG: CRTAC1 family protein [Acidobacteriota bacterium]|nr:CRTAC1 family protein [Acidobacteriota bacterium]
MRRLLPLAALMFCLLPFGYSASQSKIQNPKPEIQNPALFREVAAETGLNFLHTTGATGEYFMPEIMGSGAALLDYDNDGDLDVYLLQGKTLGGTGSGSDRVKFPLPKDFKPGNRLFRNELVPSGKLKFTDVTEAAGIGLIAYGMGVATGDYDNDGDVDLYVTNFGSNVLYRNNGNGTFTDVTAQAGVDDPRWSTSAAFVDYDQDGRLDLFVCNYVDFTVKGNKPCFAPTGEVDYCSPSSYRPVPDRLFHNDGNGKFSDVTAAAGFGAGYGPGLGVTCADFNGDGLTDIYVANDGAANLLWLNKGGGKFEESGLMAGAAYAADGAPRAGMGVTAGDIDNDGDDDLLVTNLTKQGSSFFRNNGKALFDEVTADFNLAQSSFMSTGFGVSWLDYDNDGWLDLFAANGAVTLMPSLRGQSYPFHQRNQLFHNEPANRVSTATGKERVFREITSEGGSALQLSEVSRAAAFGDIDNDGDVDVLVANNNAPARLMLNQSSKTNHWLQVKLAGVKDNRDGIGARVAVIRKSGTLWRRVHTDGSYLAANDPRVHFGLGKDAAIEGVGVIWPNGSRESWAKLKIDSLNVLKQGTGLEWKR